MNSVSGTKRALAMCAALACGLCRATGAGEVRSIPEKFDVDALAAELRSDDMEVREAAARKIYARALEHWDQLKPLAASTDPELRARARGAMARAAIQLIPHWVHEAEAAVKKHEAYRLEFQAAVKRLEQSPESLALGVRLAEVNKQIASSHDQLLKQPDAESKAALEALQQARERLNAELDRVCRANAETNKLQYAELRRVFLAQEEAARPEYLRLRTRLLQLYQLRADREVSLVYHEAMNRGYDPRTLPFEKRLRLTVSYENLGQSNAAALARLGAWTGIEVGFAPELAQHPTAKAVADERVTEQDLKSLVTSIAELIGCECKVDEAAQCITLVPKGP